MSCKPSWRRTLVCHTVPPSASGTFRCRIVSCLLDWCAEEKRRLYEEQSKEAEEKIARVSQELERLRSKEVR